MTTHLRPDVERIRAKLSGIIAPENIRAVEYPRPSRSVVEGFKAVQGPTPIVSDVLDRPGVHGIVPASVLRPILPTATIVGPALTIRYEPERLTHTQGVLEKRKSKLAHPDACVICQPGDVMAIDAGGAEFSVTGDLAALNAQKAGFVGSVVDGAIRDVDAIRRCGYPIWARHRTPQSGRLRLDAVEMNGIISIAGVRVEPGDIIVADASGIAVVPLDMAQRVLAEVQAIVAKEEKFAQDLQTGKGADWKAVLGDKQG